MVYDDMLEAQRDEIEHEAKVRRAVDRVRYEAHAARGENPQPVSNPFLDEPSREQLAARVAALEADVAFLRERVDGLAARECL